MNRLKYATPFLVAILTVTSLWAANAERLNPGQMWIPLGFSLFIAGIFLLLFWLFKWTSGNASFVASMFTLGFLFWNEAIWLMGILMIAGLIFGIRKKLKPVVNQVILIFPLIIILAIPVNLIQGFLVHAGDPDVVEVNNPVIPGQPNIYFIVPDRMPSPAAMLESGIDPFPVLLDLQYLGFYVPFNEMSMDPYTPDYDGPVYTTRTMRSFAATLNGIDVPIDINYKEARLMIKQPALFNLLHNQGYQITNVASWFNETSFFPTADFNLRFQDVSLLERLLLDELSVAYYNRTLIAGLNFRVLQSDNSIATIERARHAWQYQNLVGMAESGKTSQFIMAHIMLPHEPFIYTDAQDPMNQYLDQIEYALGYLNNLANDIQAADPSAYIIIQSDEGMAFRKPAELNNILSATQWNGVFTAWYIQGDYYLSLVDRKNILYFVIDKL